MPKSGLLQPPKCAEALEEHLENLKADKVTYGVKETAPPVGLSDQ